MKKSVLQIGMGLLLMLSPLMLQAAEKVKIAFVGEDRTGANLMAEALAQELIKKENLPALVISRGFDVSPFASDVEELVDGSLQPFIYLGGQLATQLSGNDVRHADVLLSVTAEHKQRIIGAFPYAKDKTFTMAEYATGTDGDVYEDWSEAARYGVYTRGQVEDYIEPILYKAISHKESTH